jgi:enterochelin esterase family protein
MRQDAQGIWSLTTAPVSPDLYGYSFVADGVGSIDPSNPVIKPSLLNTQSIVHVTGPDPRPWDVTDVAHGVLHHHFFRSQIVGDTRDWYVYTPPGYDGATAAPVYPVLYLFHGFSDDASGWTAVGRAHVILDNLISQGKTEPMVVIMPFGYGAPEILAGGFSGFFSSAALRKRNLEVFRESLLAEVMPLAESAYRIRSDRDGRAIAGLSMGGAEALLTGLSEPDKFGWIGSFSAGGLTEDFDAQMPGVGHKSTSTLHLLWIACGSSDHLLDINRKLRDWLRIKGVPHTGVEVAGGHTWMVWRRNLVDFASLLFRPRTG